MNTTVAAVLVIVIFGLIIVGAFAVYQRRSKIRIKGPFDTSLEIEGSNQSPSSQPAIKATEIKSRKGGLMADDHTGLGVDVSKVEVEDDVLLSSGKSRESSHPKDTPSA